MAPTGENEPLVASKTIFRFTDLPREVQKDIVSHCSQGDLICLSLVSKYFRELAATQLYRNFHIVFPDEDDSAFDSPIDGLAGGLDTFVTSDYNYAKHLRDLSLDTLSASDKAEAAYKPYLYTTSCGKFMNTLLLMTLRKAKSLESFRWNIRVELSRPVFKILHEISTLTNLHLRLQAGPSLYEAPPPLPSTSTVLSVNPPMSLWHPHVLGTITYTAPPPAPFGNSASLAYYMPSSSMPPHPVPKPSSKAKVHRKAPLPNEPPTLSGFKKLKSLSVLDIDSLDVISEIKTCVKNSTGTLSKLKLSFSESLAMQARKPPPDLDPEDSDPDDEFEVIPAGPPGMSYHDDVSGPAKVFRAQEERKMQEAVLGRIFDVEPYVAKKPQKKPREKEKDSKDEASQSPGRDFINAIKAISTKLMKEVYGPNDVSVSHQEVLDTIEAAARKYVASEESKSRDNKQKDKTGGTTSAAASATGPSTSQVTLGTTVAEVSAVTVDPSTSVSLFGQPTAPKTKETQKDVSPDDINIEEPEEQLVIEPQEDPAEEPSSLFAEPSSSKKPVLMNGNSIFDLPPKAEADPKAEKVPENVTTGFSRVAETPRHPENINEHLQSLSLDSAAKESHTSQLSDYLRQTRGLALRSLNIYLIPVKASILSRAIDLRALKRLTLLNVGPQAPIWAHLQKENKESPLPLRKIFTDNVSMPFLTFVSQLEELHELFILERETKHKPESFAPKTAVTIDQIRRLVLNKHMPALKRLMIKNMSDTSWDVNEKAVMLICKRGKQLQELACSMGIRSIHTLMQQIPGLVSLRALHIVRIRNDDTCVWVMRETKRFLIDNVSHHPDMKLEWVSIDEEDRVERLVRSSDIPKKKKEKKQKSKGKQKATAGTTANTPFPVLPPPDTWDISSDSEEDEDLHHTKIETMGDIHFYDVWSIRIFNKEVVYGRL
ncbi:hypothetical protein B0T17DRAFT_508894 [Bombardia bombarda]|uniref:F-box domain-containing protein n=1 Tax=Bombardia bombarda TaxID=252184 RepID=A0AA39WUG9_9PEZI|nr:hypothetical protein B0T17DRAFT_508894 [Bombardia bombarda]